MEKITSQLLIYFSDIQYFIIFKILFKKKNKNSYYINYILFFSIFFMCTWSQNFSMYHQVFILFTCT